MDPIKNNIEVKKQSLFIACLDCQNIISNPDDNVCLSCGSKSTKRIFIGNKVFEETYN